MMGRPTGGGRDMNGAIGVASNFQVFSCVPNIVLFRVEVSKYFFKLFLVVCYSKNFRLQSITTAF